MAAACGHCGQHHEAYVTMCPVTGARLGSASYTLVNDDEALVGTVIGDRYHVRDILGQGSTGTVFSTVHMHFERAAAMKVLRPRYVARDTILRVFHDESRLAFSVSHPSLCEVFDIGTLPDGAPFFVMERLEGETLASRLGRERFSTAAAVDLTMQLLAVMEAVHARDLLLRDLRPQNIFLAQRRGCRPVLKVMDFGLSSLVPLERVQAQWDGLRAVVGRNDGSGALSIPYYLSPERTRSEQAIEPASDLFVAAVILYEALTGQKPFNGSTWNGLVGQIAHAHPTPLAVLRPDVPEELGSLVMRTLSAHPRSRPASACDMQDELRAVFEGPKRTSQSMRTAPVSAGDQAAPPVPSAAASPAAASAPRSDFEHADNLTPFLGMPVPLPSAVRMPQAPSPRPAAGMRAAETMPLAAPSAARPEPPEERIVDDLYEDETRTDKHTDVTVSARVGRVIDEASADHPVRTVRPPTGYDIDIDVDMGQLAPPTSRGEDLSGSLELTKHRTEEEDETETMQLTPELRARIDQMTKRSPPSETEDTNRPPATRRLTKPPG